MDEESRLGTSNEIIFPERKSDEPPNEYWGRTILVNLERGVPYEEVAKKFGEILGEKEKREGIDELTELKTKRVLFDDLKEVLGHISRQAKEGNLEKASIILLDLDDFKKQNDTRGYLWGDQILKKVAEVLRTERRAEDIVARYGGEEFCLILGACSSEEATKIAEQLRKSIETIGITASFGVAESSRTETPEDFFHKANVACAIAKGSISHPNVTGAAKNRVVLWQPDMPVKLENKNG